MLTLFLFSIVISAGIDTETPEEFLHILADSDAELWVEHQSTSGSHIESDTILTIIRQIRNLSVEPGPRELEDIEGGYQVIFPESRWTWRLDGGRIGSVTGQAIVEWHPGGYTWVTVPVISEEAATIGRKESLCMGATIMLAIGFVGIIAIWYAKKKYG